LPHNDALYLAHMLDTARKASSKARHLAFEEFSADENLHLACLHLVQTMGEAAARVSAETRARRADMPWRQITGMRRRIAHNYLDVDLEVVWQVIRGDLPDLIASLERVVTAE
jgi:uncharacterized protein with HEPN domain